MAFRTPNRSDERDTQEPTREQREGGPSPSRLTTMIHRVRGFLGTLFQSSGARPRRRRGGLLGGEALESRMMMMSGVPVEIGSIFSGESIETLEARHDAKEGEVAVVDQSIAALPDGLELSWAPSGVTGWDGELVSTHGSWMHDSVLSGSGRFLVAGFQDGRIEIRSSATGAVSAVRDTGVGRAYFFSANPTNDHVYVSAGYGAGAMVIAIDATTGTELWRRSAGGDGGVNRSSVSADGSRVLVDIDGRGVVGFDTGTGGVVSASQDGDYGGTAVGGGMSFFRSGRELWRQKADGTRSMLTTVEGMYYETAVSPNQEWIAVGGSGGVISMVNMQTGAERRWSGNGGAVNEITFVGNETLVVAHEGGVVEVWNVAGATPVLTKSANAGASWIHGLDSVQGTVVLRTGTNQARWRALTLPDPAVEAARDALFASRDVLEEEIEGLEALIEAKKTPLQLVGLSIDLSEEDEETATSWVQSPVRMQVTLEHDDYGVVSVSSPYDRSYVVSALGSSVVEHPGGGENVMIEHRYLRGLLPPAQSGDTTGAMSIYADAEHTIKLYELTLKGSPYGGRFDVLSSVASSIPSSALPAGFDAAEAEPATVFAVASVSGPNVVVVTQTNQEAEIRFSGVQTEGALSRARVSTSQDGGYRAVSLTINPSNPSTECLLIMTGRDGRDLGVARVSWNAETKQLQLLSGQSVPADAAEDVNAVTAQLHALQQDPSLGDRTLSAYQGGLMTDMLRSLPAPYNAIVQDFDATLMRARPNWTDEALRQEAIATHGTFDVTQVFQGLVRNRNDETRALRSAYGTYYAMMGELLREASVLLSAIRRGGHEQDLRSAFAVMVDHSSSSLAMVQLASIGIRLPNAGTMLEAAKCLWDVRGAQLMDFKAQADARLQREAVLLAEGYVKGADDTWKKPQVEQTEAALDPAVAAHNLRVIAMSEGIGSAADRVMAYANRYKLSATFVASVTGFDVSQVAAIRNTDAVITGIDVVKNVSASGDLLTPMTHSSLTSIRLNAEKALASATARGDTERATFFQEQVEAATGLLALIPAGGQEPVIDGHPEAVAWVALIERTTSDPISLGTFAEANFTNMKEQLTPGGTKTLMFTLTDTAMVNVVMPAVTDTVDGPWSQARQLWHEPSTLARLSSLVAPKANFSVTLRNEKGEVVSFSGRDAMSADSLSLKLPRGTYTMTIGDTTSYGGIQALTEQEKASITLPPVTLSLVARGYNSANIEGVMSIDGNPEAMPVRMRVAEFVTNVSGNLERNQNYDGKIPGQKTVDQLNKNLPVWVVVHGMYSSENDGIMEELAKSLSAYHQSGIQVVTIDWNEAANPVAPTQDAPWAVGVGQWAAAQLIKAGFAPEKINGCGWSHGTYGLFEMGQEIKRLSGQQVNALVALDAANNIPYFSGYDHSKVDFAAVSRNSLAIDSSIVAGSNSLAATADVAIKMNSNVVNPFTRHKLAVTGFTRMLTISREQNGEFDEYFSLATLMGSSDNFRSKFTTDSYEDAYEGVMDVVLTEDDNDIFPTVPTIFKIRKPNASQETTIDWNNFYA